MTEGLPLDVGHHLQVVVSSLERRFAGIFGRETIVRYMEETLDRWPVVRVTSHLPVLTERFLKERLTALAQSEGTIVKEVPEVLFVCTHNAGRSQMAAGLLHLHAQGRVHVRSAGTQPGEVINPAVVEAMAEVGVDLAMEYPKPLTDEVVRAADVVITMGCGDACPVYPGKRYLDWDLPDPANKPTDEVRPIRDEIDRRVKALLEELIPAST